MAADRGALSTHLRRLGAPSAAMMMFLVFLPPAAYRNFVERRARAI